MADLAVTDENFEEEVLKADKPVLVDFWASWCMPCQMLGPVIEELAEEMGDDVKVYKLNVDENKMTAGKYQVMSIPTVMVFHNGEAQKTLVGVQPKEAYENALKEVLKK